MADNLIENLLQKPFKPLDLFLDPLIWDGSLTMIYAPPGIGKTWLTLWLASSLSGAGYFFKWKASRVVPVYYLDSEMGQRALAKRIRHIVDFGKLDMRQQTFRYTSPDCFKNGIVPNIADSDAQAWYEKDFGPSEVVIIDNLGSASAPIGRENDEQTWQRILPWVIRLRGQGRAVIIIHHSGKSGDQLGTSRKQQALDTEIKLIRPFDYQPKDGLRLELHFTKTREVAGGDSIEPISINLQTSEDSLQWTWASLKEFRKRKVGEMDALGMSVVDIARHLVMSFYEVKVILNELKNGSNYYESEDDGGSY